LQHAQIAMIIQLVSTRTEAPRLVHLVHKRLSRSLGSIPCSFEILAPGDVPPPFTESTGDIPPFDRRSLQGDNRKTRGDPTLPLVLAATGHL